MFWNHFEANGEIPVIKNAKKCPEGAILTCDSCYTSIEWSERVEHEISLCTLGSDEACSDARGHLGVTWGVYLCAGKPPLADIILSHPPDLT